ncbi:hypothetical protein M9H77_21077 [Catharanthus roseus]|uniref:Uncharacterized protein n=1 Tax=Catharanthus roseus TaxID=4058 RepID=A0ACC0ANL5_CATRO|nr:hypothetical protein M9H77_21077 [Catharanthus roseus]
MAQTSPLSLILFSLIPSLLLLQIQAQSPTAPAPAPAGPINLTAILEKAGQFNTFNRFLGQTQVGNQINNQVNNSHDGMTVLAPTDNAFQNLPSGTLNRLSDQQQVQLILYHVLPKFYGFEDLQTVSNPVRTQASGQDGKVFGLNFTGEANQNQVNVTSGEVTTTIYNALRKDFPLAVYQVDKVLLPQEFFETNNNASAPAASSSKPTLNSTRSDSGDNGKGSEGPSSSPNGSNKKMNVGLGFISGLSLLCMGLLS